MELNKFNAKYTAREMIEKLQEENKYLREELVEEKVKSEGNIRALNKVLEEVRIVKRQTCCCVLFLFCFSVVSYLIVLCC